MTATIGPLTRRQLQTLRAALENYLESTTLIKLDEPPGERRQWLGVIASTKALLARVDRAEHDLYHKEKPS